MAFAVRPVGLDAEFCKAPAASALFAYFSQFSWCDLAG